MEIPEGSDRRVVLLQQMVARKVAALEPDASLASSLGYGYPLAQEVFDTEAGGEVKHLEHLADFGYLDRDFFDRIHLCACEKRQFAINFREACVRCHSTNIDVTALIHHYRCGYIGPESEFLDGVRYTCPKCDTRLKHIGVDYEKAATDYQCASCGHVFSEPDTLCRCLVCNQEFDVDRALLVTLHVYRINARGMLAAERGTLEMQSDAPGIIDNELSVYTLEYLQERLAQEVAGARRYGRPLAVVIGTISNLSAFEVENGRQSAARVFRSFTARARESLRDSDAAAVFDDYNLVMMLTDTPLEGASVVARRLHEQSERYNEDQLAPALTLSFGVAGFDDQTPGGQQLFELALARLQRAVGAGGGVCEE